MGDAVNTYLRAARRREAELAAALRRRERGPRARSRTRDAATLLIVWALATAALSGALWPVVTW